MKTHKNLITKIAASIVCTITVLAGMGGNAFAEKDEKYYGIGMSPMNQKIILAPGETYYGTFKINNPATHELDFKYIVKVTPFYVNENYDIYYENNGDYSQIVDWVTVGKTNGIISPNSTEEIPFSIEVPLNAPAGGQYVAIMVSSDNSSNNTSDNDDDNNLNITINQAMAHIIYAEIAGTTVRQGEVASADVPGFMLSGNIAGTSSIKNTGNVHGTATYKLQVFPLFSNEEVYTNEEKPEEKTILPDRTLMSTTEWAETPAVGIFNVVYTVEFEGVTTQVSKMVIKCPIWLLFIIIFAIVAIIIWLMAKSKSRKKARR